MSEFSIEYVSDNPAEIFENLFKSFEDFITPKQKIFNDLEENLKELSASILGRPANKEELNKISREVLDTIKQEFNIIVENDYTSYEFIPREMFQSTLKDIIGTYEYRCALSELGNIISLTLTLNHIPNEIVETFSNVHGPIVDMLESWEDVG